MVPGSRSGTEDVLDSQCGTGTQAAFTSRSLGATPNAQDCDPRKVLTKLHINRGPVTTEELARGAPQSQCNLTSMAARNQDSLA